MVEAAGIEPDPSRSTNLDIITEVDAAAHGSQIAARLGMLEMPHAGSGVGLFGVREDS